MSEFLHKVVANREYIQRDRELHAAMREAIEAWTEEENSNG